MFTQGGFPVPNTGTLENEAYQRIKQAILTRKLLPGSKLSEPALARQLKISRTPVRAAIKRLVAEGLAKAETNQGAEVALPSAKDIQEVLFMRETLEPLGARLAALHARPVDIDPLEELIAAEEKAFREKDLNRYIEVNDKFHLTVAHLSDNRLLEQAITNYLTLYDVFLALFDPIYELRDEEMQSMLEHRLLVDALRKRDEVAAEAAMRYHLSSSRKYASSDIVEKKLLTLPENQI